MATGSPPSAVAPRYVRVTGERNGLVEFEYAVGDLSMVIELMLPPRAFEEFCTANKVLVVEASARQAMDVDEAGMNWRPSDVQRRI